MRVPHPEENTDWLKEKKEQVKAGMNEEQRDTTADLLTEMLYLAMTCPDHVRSRVMYLCEGIADLVDEEVAKKCEEFAMFRHSQSKR